MGVVERMRWHWGGLTPQEEGQVSCSRNRIRHNAVLWLHLLAPPGSGGSAWGRSGEHGGGQVSPRASEGEDGGLREGDEAGY